MVINLVYLLQLLELFVFHVVNMNIIFCFLPFSMFLKLLFLLKLMSHRRGCCNCVVVDSIILIVKWNKKLEALRQG